MVLYFLHAIRTDLVKVGVSKSFDERLRVLRSNCPDEIEVLRIFHGDRDLIEALERELHKELEPVPLSRRVVLRIPMKVIRIPK